MPRHENGVDLLDCDHPRDGRAEVSFVSCNRIVCEEDAGSHTCRSPKHSTLPRFERHPRKNP